MVKDHSYKILLVDDDPHIRGVLCYFLQDLGFTVFETSNGHSALPLIWDHHPDLVFCDMVMPGISGLMVLRQIRSEFPDQKVIMMSGLQEASAADEARKLGAVNYCVKPLSLDQIELILQDIFPHLKH